METAVLPEAIDALTCPMTQEPPQLDAFTCPITQETFVDPVLVVDGHTYERVAIEKWFGQGHLKSPVTGVVLGSTILLQNHTLRKALEGLRGAGRAQPCPNDDGKRDEGGAASSSCPAEGSRSALHTALGSVDPAVDGLLAALAEVQGPIPLTPDHPLVSLGLPRGVPPPPDVYECLVRTVKGHMEEARVVAAVLGAMDRVMVESDFSRLVRMRLVDAGACQAVPAALLRYSITDGHVSKTALSVIIGLTEDHELSIVRAIGAGACEGTCEAMRSCSTCRLLQWRGCLLMLVLTRNGSLSTSCRRLMAAGACELVIQAVRSFPDLDMHDTVLNVIGALLGSTHDMDINHRLRAAGACELVCSGMRDFAETKDIQAFACIAVARLSMCTDSAERLMASCAPTLICAAMGAFADDVTLQTRGCEALLGLAGNGNEAIRLGLVTAGACERLCLAMRAFPGHLSVQKVSCLAVAYLALDETNIARLVAAGAGAALCTAMAAFPTHIGVQATGSQAIASLVTQHQGSWRDLELQEQATIDDRRRPYTRPSRLTPRQIAPVVIPRRPEGPRSWLLVPPC